MKSQEKNKGITLVALVVTIIVLIILAGISINLMLGDNGIITKAQEAKQAQEIAELKERIQMKIVTKETDKIQKGEKITQNDIEDILEEFGTVNKKEDEIESITPNGKDYEIPYEDIYVNVESSDIEESKEPEVPVRTTVKHYIVDPAGTTDDTIFCNELKVSDWWNRSSFEINTNYVANQYKLYDASGSTNSNDVKISKIPLDGSKYKSITVKCLYYYDGGSYPNGCIYLTNSITGTTSGTNWYMPTSNEIIQKFACGSGTKTQEYYRNLTGNSSWTYQNAIVDLTDPAWETYTFDLSEYDGDIYISVFNNNGYLYVASIEVEQYADTIE